MAILYSRGYDYNTKDSISSRYNIHKRRVLAKLVTYSSIWRMSFESVITGAPLPCKIIPIHNLSRAHLTHKTFLCYLIVLTRYQHINKPAQAWKRDHTISRPFSSKQVSKQARRLPRFSRLTRKTNYGTLPP